MSTGYRKRICVCMARVFAVLAILAGINGTAEAQQQRKMRTVGWVSSGDRLPAQFNSFKAAMRDLGWVEGGDVIFEIRRANRQRDRLPSLFGELMAARVDVIVSQGGAISGALDLPGDTPIVFGYSGDPVSAGVVKDLAKPGGRFTGVSFMSFELNDKRLELIHEILPTASRVAILGNPRHPGEELELKSNEAAAKRLGLHLYYAPVRHVSDFAFALEGISRSDAQAIVVLQDGFFGRYIPQVTKFAGPRRIPVISGWKEYIKHGVMMTYGPSRNQSYRRVAYYVDRILKGAKPAELPIERPSRFELVIDLKIAKALGISIPRSVLVRADEVID